MNSNYEIFRDRSLSALRSLARAFPEYDDANMLVGSSEAEATLFRQNIFKKIDTDWIDAIERAIPALDLIVRNPSVAIEDVDEILPVELSRHITEKSIKHLAQHTNLILNVDGDEVTPQKILNVYHDETYLTYENKFVNTLLARLSAFVDKRFQLLVEGSGTERSYEFNYKTEFEHHLEDGGGRNSARIHLRIELTSPLDAEASESNVEVNESYARAVERIRRINMALLSYRASAFATKMGRNYIRPPVIRTNAILKNKNLRECLTLWEFIEGFDKVGYSMTLDELAEMPSASYIEDLYSSVALQYLNFYNGVAENEGNRLLSKKHLFDVDPEFDTEHDEDELDDYMVYDSEYRKTVPVSRLMNNRKKLSDDEKRIYTAIKVALRADEILNEEIIRAEEEARRVARERRLAEEEAKRRAEEEARRIAEEEAARLAAEEAAARALENLDGIRLRRSYMARLIQSSENIQDYYTRIKNLLLSYKRVKSRISWKSESFKRGREHIAKIDIKGKKLYLYLALDPAEFADSKYFVNDVSEKSPELPLLLKVKSDRAMKHAEELIALLAERMGLVLTDRVPENYHLPYETDRELVDRGLIKLVKLDYVPDDTKPEAVAEPASEETQEEYPLVVEIEAANAEVSDEAADGYGEIRLRRSYTARLIQSADSIKEYYNEIKNTLLSYKGVKSRTSWKSESFKRGREHIAKIDIKGKKLYLYLALDPAEFADSKYFINDVSAKSAELPLLLKVKSDRAMKHASELIEILAERLALVKLDKPEEDYRLPYETDKELVERELIKLVKLDTALDDTKPEPVTEFVIEETMEAVAAEPTAEETQEEYSLVVEIEAANAEVSGESADGYGEIRLRRSYTARLIQSADSIKEYYNEIKNTLLSYKGVKSRTSWKAESFKQGRTHIAKIDIKGKKLYLYLALDPAEFADSKYFINDVSAKSAELPLLLKVKSDRAMKHASELIAILAERKSLRKTERSAEDYRMPYETDEALTERELIKLVMSELAETAETDNNSASLSADIPSENTSYKLEAERNSDPVWNLREDNSNVIIEASNDEFDPAAPDWDVAYSDDELAGLSRRERREAEAEMERLEDYRQILSKMSELRSNSPVSKKAERKLMRLMIRAEKIKSTLPEDKFGEIIKRLER